MSTDKNPQIIDLPDDQSLAMAQIANDLQRSTLKVSLDRNPALIYLNGLAPSGRKSAQSQLKKLACSFGYDKPSWLQDMPWWELRSRHLKAILAAMSAQNYAPGSINLVLSVLRGVARESFDNHLLSIEELERIKLVKRAKGSRLLPGRYLPIAEFKAIINSCNDRTLYGSRDGAILGLMYGTGFRRSTIAQLSMDNLFLDEGVIRVVVKGNKEHEAPLPKGTFQAIASWVAYRGNRPGPLFCVIRKNGDMDLSKAMTSQSVYKLFLKRVSLAGVPHASPHDLRRTFITSMLELTGDLALVQSLAGHADPRTTIRYDRRGERAKREAIDLLEVPLPGSL